MAITDDGQASKHAGPWELVNRDGPMSDARTLAGDLQRLLGQVPVLPRRLVLDTQGVPATIPVLRGVWGRALHGLDSTVYERVFHPTERQRLPGYVLRPASELEPERTAVEWILLGEAVEHEAILLRAWDVASGMGIGKRREPFFVRDQAGLHPDGGRAARPYRWFLDQVPWPMAESIERTGCQLCFPLPLSLLRDHRLIDSPTLTDLVVRACRRIGAFLPAASRADWDVLTGQAIGLAGEIPFRGEWREPLALQRYSAAQQRDFAVPGVSGRLHLPEGPNELWPLLAALAWTHVGKASNLGLGQTRIEILASP
jgi:hypothetical protein